MHLVQRLFQTATPGIGEQKGHGTGEHIDHEEDEVTEVVNEGTVEITETPSAPETPNENNGAESNDQAETKED
jgi:hypothetical protein